MSNIENNFTNAVNEFQEAQGTMLESDRESLFELVCEVKVVRETRTNVDARGIANQYEATIVYLVPVESTMAIRFWNCYLPDYIASLESELVFMSIRHARAFRAFLEVADKHVPKRHIKVMTIPMIEQMAKLDGDKIRVDCLPCSEHDKFDV